MQDTFILKTCSNCKKEKSIAFFSKRGNQCKDCQKEKRETLKSTKQQYDQEYRSMNKDKLLSQQRTYDHNNREKIKTYKKQYVKQRRANDFIFKLRSYVSKSIATYIRLGGAHKQGSCLSYLPYSMQELKEHLQGQFYKEENKSLYGEYWMNWGTYGKYNSKTWKNNDPSTWTWTIDHIVPQSDLPYASMQDDNFKKCWALSNLRPLSAKQNLIDGATKKRHNSGGKNE